jgi:hypothetical protein
VKNISVFFPFLYLLIYDESKLKILYSGIVDNEVHLHFFENFFCDFY